MEEYTIHVYNKMRHKFTSLKTEAENYEEAWNKLRARFIEGERTGEYDIYCTIDGVVENEAGQQWRSELWEKAMNLVNSGFYRDRWYFFTRPELKHQRIVVWFDYDTRVPSGAIIMRWCSYDDVLRAEGKAEDLPFPAEAFFDSLSECCEMEVAPLCEIELFEEAVRQLLSIVPDAKMSDFGLTCLEETRKKILEYVKEAVA